MRHAREWAVAESAPSAQAMVLVLVVHAPVAGAGGGGPVEAAGALRAAAEAADAGSAAGCGPGGGGGEGGGGGGGGGGDGAHAHAQHAAPALRTVMVLPSATSSFALFEALEAEDSAAALEQVAAHVEASVGNVAPAAKCQMHVIADDGIYDNTGPAEVDSALFGDRLDDAARGAVEAAANAGKLLSTLKLQDRAKAAVGAGFGIVANVSKTIASQSQELALQAGGEQSGDVQARNEAEHAASAGDDGVAEGAEHTAEPAPGAALAAGWRTFSSWGKSVLREVQAHAAPLPEDPLVNVELSSNPIGVGDEIAALSVPEPVHPPGEPSEADRPELAQVPAAPELEHSGAVPEQDAPGAASADTPEPPPAAAAVAPPAGDDDGSDDDAWLDD